MQTHRCKGSLKATVSIRKTFEREFMRDKYDKEEWRLFSNGYDFEYDVHTSTHVSKIRYCPYCGIELKNLKIRGDGDE